MMLQLNSIAHMHEIDVNIRIIMSQPIKYAFTQQMYYCGGVFVVVDANE